MLWSFVAGAVSFGLCGGLAPLLVRDPGKKQLRIAVAVGGGVLMSGLAQEFLVKPHEADVALQQVKIFRVLKEREPQAYASIRAEFLAGAKDDEAAAFQLGARASKFIAPLTAKYMPLASDEALLHFVTVVVAETEQLRNHDPELARRFLFPAQGEAIDPTPYVDAETLKESVDVVADLIDSGAVGKPHADDPQRADELLRGVMADLAKAHGQDLALLSRASAPDTDAAKVTAIVMDLYRGILALPAADSAMVLRKLLSKT
jgi:hypothetical protein